MKISLKKIAKILDFSIDTSLEVCSYAIDSRKVQKGGIFFALPGKRVYGENYLEEVAEKGGYAAVVSKAYKGFGFGLILFSVEDVLKSLHLLAKKIVEENSFKIIAITGSVGKTTTKEIIYHLLSTKYNVSMTKGNYNSQRMLPIGILETDCNSDFLLLEMGMTKAEDIQKLVDMAPPEVVVLTQITYCHSENFSSLEDIAKGKAEIFTPYTKYAVIHKNSAKFQAVYENCISHHTLYPQTINVMSPYSYSPFSENFSAAYHVCKYLGMKDDQIRLASMLLPQKTTPHRYEKIVIDEITYIDDSYNANVLSVNAALENLPSPKGNGRKIFVFGEMKELGGVKEVCHQIVAKKAVKSVDIALCIGLNTKYIVEEFLKEKKQASFFYEFRSLKDALYKIVRKGDVVLIKGSNSFKLWKLLEVPSNIVNNT